MGNLVRTISRNNGSTIDLDKEFAKTINTIDKLINVALKSGNNFAIINADGQLHVVLPNTVDPNNSTSTLLNADAVFTGTGTDVSRYTNVTVQLFSDQTSATDGMQFQFSTDNTNWDDSFDFTLTANVARRFQFPVTAQYFRLVYTNGSVDQTAFRVQTILHAAGILTTIHRIKDAISEDNSAQLMKTVLCGENPGGTFVNFQATTAGNFKISLEELENNVSVNSNKQLKVTSFDSTGLEPDLDLPKTAFGDLRVAELSPIIQGSFEYTVDNTELNTNTETNDGTVTQANGMAVMTTSTTTGGIARLISRRHAKYRAGLGGLCRFTALYTTGVASTSQWAGIMDETGSTADFKNGYAIGYNGDTFGIARFSNDSLTFVALSACDDPLDGTGPSGITLDTTKLNVFAIQYQYLGAGAIYFSIENSTTGDFVLFHTIQYANTNTEPSTHNPNFHLTFHVDNKSTTSNLIMKTSSYSYFLEGKTEFFETHQPEFSSGRKTKGTVTTEVALFTIRNKSSYASKTNFVDLILKRLSIGIEANSANNLGQWRLVKDTTLGGTPSYSDIDTSDSLVDIDTAGTTLTGGKELLSGDLAGKNDKLIENLSDYKIILGPGETITLSGISANSATFNGSLLWKELF